MLAGFKRVVRNGNEVYCKNEHPIDSRAQMIETCLTPSQMQQAYEDSQSMLRDIQRSGQGVPANAPGTGGIGW